MKKLESTLRDSPAQGEPPVRAWRSTAAHRLFVAVFACSTVAACSIAPHATASLAEPLQGLIKSARHPDLKYSSFADFRAELERLYARAGWEPLWLGDAKPTRAALMLIGRLAGADSLGLAPSDYDAAWLERTAHALASQPETTSAERLARFDLGLSVAAVRFVSDLHRGRVKPDVVHAQLFIPRRTLSAEMAVDSLRNVNQQARVLEHVQPAFEHYRRVNLTHAVPVYIVYATAIARENGDVYFF